jgi:simple sugar transport system permease protein
MTESPATTLAGGLQQRWSRLVTSGTGLNIIGLLAAIAILYLVLSLTATGFTSAPNQMGLLRDAAMIGVVATGMTLVIVAGEIDVSIGPAVALSTVIFAKAMTSFGMPALVAILFTLALGGLWGLLVGYLRAKVGVPSFIGTLGLWNILGGLALFTTDALPVPIPITDPTVDLLSGRILGIPTPAWVMLIAFVLFGYISTRTAYGRSVFAVGGNSASSRLAGINVARIRMLIFVTTGALSALSGVLLAARLGSGNGGAAKGLEFSIIAAVVVGGTAMTGGRGSLLGTFLGVIFITLLGNGLVLLGVNSFLQQVVSGAIIVIAVLLNVLISRRRGISTTD